MKGAMSRIVGIDLGTTNSLVGYVDDGGVPRVIPDAEGRKLLPSIVKGLLDGGLEADTPAAAIERATWPNQRVIRASVARIAEEARRVELDSPAILVIGRTVALADAIASVAGLEQAAA